VAKIATLVSKEYAGSKLTENEKVEVKADAAFVAVLLTSDAAGVTRFVERINRNQRLLRQEGDMKGKRPEGCQTHETEDIAKKMVEIVKRKGLIKAG
jgi:hypothetical protein